MESEIKPMWEIVAILDDTRSRFRIEGVNHNYPSDTRDARFAWGVSSIEEGYFMAETVKVDPKRARELVRVKSKFATHPSVVAALVTCTCACTCVR